MIGFARGLPFFRLGTAFGAKNADTIVAFPLPDIDTNEFYGSALGTVTDDPVNFVGFTVAADGWKIVPQVEQRASCIDWSNRKIRRLAFSRGKPWAI